VLTVLFAASGVSGEMHTALNMTIKAKPSDELISDPPAPRAWVSSPRSASCWWCRWLPAPGCQHGSNFSRTVRRQDPLGGS